MARRMQNLNNGKLKKLLEKVLIFGLTEDTISMQVKFTTEIDKWKKSKKY